jgi:ribosomal protein L37AE/L43A
MIAALGKYHLIPSVKRLRWVGLVVLFAASFLWARAGGGNSYHSGGGSSHSSGSGGGFHFSSPSHNYGPSNYGGGGGGGFSGSGLLILILVGVSIYFIIRLRKKSIHRTKVDSLNQGSSSGAINPPYSGQKGKPFLNDRAETSAMASPAAERLLRSLPRLFIAVQKAWSDRDMEQVHRVVSDGVHSRWGIQLELMRREGRRNWIKDPTLLDATILQERCEGIYESIDVKIWASIIDIEIREGDAPPVSNPEATEFEEVWSFTRKVRDPNASDHGTVSDTKEYDEQCPNCGASLLETQGVKCGHCGAMLNSGAYDWVLAEITQIGEWQPLSLQRMQVDPTVSNKDPHLSVQELEDRAATVFVRMVDALLQKRPAILRPYANESLVTEMTQGKAEWIPRALQNLAVGKVELESFQVVGEPPLAQLNAKIRIRYSAGRNTMLPESQPHDLVFHFRKFENAVTKGGLNSLNCPNCAAPVAGSDKARCEYCGETLNDPAHHWVLDKVT